MTKTTRIGLPVILFLVVSLLVSCATTVRSPDDPVRDPPTKEELIEMAEAIIGPEEISQHEDLAEIEVLLESWHDDNLSFDLDADGSMRLRVSIVFRADNADFMGLSHDIIANNAATLDRVAEILHILTDYSIIIEGHANPAAPPGPQRDREEPMLIRLSEQRALRVVDELGHRGVPLNKNTVRGLGGSRPLFNFNDPVNNWRNRRVEFVLYKRTE